MFRHSWINPRGHTPSAHGSAICALPGGDQLAVWYGGSREGAADVAERGRRIGTRVGKVTHPSAAPDNHLLMVWSVGPVNGGYTVDRPAVDGGIYMLKGGTPANEPGDLLLIKNDPRYNEQWPRAVVPYKRIHGVNEPKRHEPLANDGKLIDDIRKYD